MVFRTRSIPAIRRTRISTTSSPRRRSTFRPCVIPSTWHSSISTRTGNSLLAAVCSRTTSSTPTWASSCRKSLGSACLLTPWSWSCITAVDGYSVTSKTLLSHLQGACPPPYGGGIGRMRGSPGVIHERDGSVWSPGPHRAMLSSYAARSVYLNVDRLRGCVLRYRLQVGGRERGHALQRSTARKRGEGPRSGAADVQGD